MPLAGRLIPFLALVPALCACDMIPGTEAHSLAEGERIAAEQLIDPTSAMFRNSAKFVGETKDGELVTAICGEINGKNRNGAYAGYGRFIALVDSEEAVIEPVVMYDREEVDRMGQQCLRDAKGPFRFAAEKDLALLQCEQARDAAQELAELTSFEIGWASWCSSPDGDEVHLSELVTVLSQD